MASSASHDQRVELLGTVQVLPEHLTASRCQTVCEPTRTTARARQWTLAALAACWTAVISRAPQTLTQALEAAAAHTGAGWPSVQARPEAFFARCQSWHWRFCATLYAAFADHVLPDARPCSAPPLQSLRPHCPDVWVVEGSRLDAGAPASSCGATCGRVCDPAVSPLSLLCTAASRAIWRSTRTLPRAHCPGRSLPWSTSPRDVAGWGALVRGGDMLCGLEPPRHRGALSVPRAPELALGA